MIRSILSLNQRKDIYIEVLNQYISGKESGGVCGNLRYYGVALIGNPEISSERDFPEFAKQKPWFVDRSGWWWSMGIKGTRKRIKALQKAIKLVQKQLKENDKH